MDFKHKYNIRVKSINPWRVIFKIIWYQTFFKNSDNLNGHLINNKYRGRKKHPVFENKTTLQQDVKAKVSSRQDITKAHGDQITHYNRHR